MPPLTAFHHQPADWHRSSSFASNRSDDQYELDATILAAQASNLSRLHRQATIRSCTGDQDLPDTHQKFKSFIRDREEEPSGWHPDHKGVCFESLTTRGGPGLSSSPKTLRTALWRTIICKDIYEWTLNRWFKRNRSQMSRPIISDLSGVVRGGEMMLVLGRPGSGCSTFLKTIANQHSHFEKVEGFLSYSGLTPQEVEKSFRGEVIYVPEEDEHFPTLTVRQTLDFVLRSKVPRRYHEEIPDYLNMYGEVFGMSHVLDTLVGNEYIRGISGGERKRVSIMEALAVDAAVIAWDNSTRGLDASSAGKYAQSLRVVTDVTGKATLVTLYQVSDAIIKLMDKIILLDQGRMIYQGPAHEAQVYFEELGFEKAPEQSIADFLTSITTPSQRKIRDGWQSRAPKSPEELELAFRTSRYYASIVNQVDDFKKSLSGHGNSPNAPQLKEGVHAFQAAAPVKKSKYVPTTSAYNTSFLLQLRLSMQREWWVLRQHLYPLYVRFMNIVIVALLLGSMIYNMPENTTGMYSRGGFIFYASIVVGWVQLAELEGAMNGRGIIARHKRQAMVRPSAVALAKVVGDTAIILAESVLFCFIAYFLAGMKSEAGAFFIFTLFTFVLAFCFTQIYRFFAAFSPSFELALRYCGVVLLVCILYGGYLYPPKGLLADVPWVAWISYAVPVRYAFEALLATEFGGVDFACESSSQVPRGAIYDSSLATCAISGSIPGQTAVLGDRYLSEYYDFSSDHIWQNFGIILGMSMIYVLASLVLLEHIDWSTGTGAATGLQKFNKKRSKAVQQDPEGQPSGETVATDPSQDGQETAITPTQAVFTWENITYKIPYGESERTLLNEVSGFCRPGEMTALVGASGAGKSTLLTVLTQRQRTGTVTGNIKVNGKVVNPAFVKDIGFCPQMDIHDETSTVGEAFVFSALLRQDASVPYDEKIAYTEDIMATLGMVDCRDVLIGSLSIEGKRRASIGVELCAKPKLLLFLDEPTSGLDSQGATSIVSLLRKLANGGQAIVCTIHQASHQQFEMFDRVLALNPGGLTFYNGSVGPACKHVLQYFEDHGCPAEPGKNAADFIIEVGTGSIRPADNPDFVNWETTWKQSKPAHELEATIRSIHETQSSITTDGAKDVSQAFSSSTFYQARLLTVRNMRQFYRISEYTYARLYASTIHALFNGLTFLQLDNSLFSLQAAAYSVFLILMLVPEFINGISMRFIANRNIWLEKELPSRTYGWFAFATAQIIAELPYALVGAVVFYLIFYFMVGLPLGLPAGYVFLMTLAFHLFSTNWGQWIAAMSPDAMTAANLMPFFIIMCELFNGILQPVYEMPAFWRYTMYYVAPFTYWISGTLGAVLRDRPVVCDVDELIEFMLPLSNSTCGQYAQAFLETSTGYLSNPDAAGEGTMCGYCQYTTGEEFLQLYRISGSQIWWNLGIFIGFVCSNYLLVYVLVLLNSPQRPSVRGLLGWK